MSARKPIKRKPKAPAVVVAYKGFDKDMKCRGFQFEVGKTYEHTGSVKRCESGFHSCEHPLDVLGYYSPGEGSRYAVVEASGELSREESGDTKLASARLDVRAELQIPDLIAAAVKFVFDHAKPTKGATNKRKQKVASNSGDYGAASNSGYQGAASNSGQHGVAAHFGYDGRAKSDATGAIFLVNRNDDFSIRHVFASKVGENGIKAGVFYRLDEHGKPQEVA